MEPPQKLRLVIGEDSFKEVARNGFNFVDKSLFIHQVLSEILLVCLILRPRRFGKSFNLSMLKSFFDVNGAEQNRLLFSRLKISNQHPQHFAKEGDFGKHPVIYAGFKVFYFQISY